MANYATGSRNHNFKDLTGVRFGDWTVLHRVVSHNRRAYWLCRCKCGTEETVRGGNLNAGKSKRCSNCRKSPAPRTRVRPEYKTEHLIEDVEWMFETGETPTRAAERLGMRPRTVRERLRKAQRGDLASHFDRALRESQEA